MLIDISTEKQKANGTIVLKHTGTKHKYESTMSGYIRDVTNPYSRYQLNSKDKNGPLSRKLIMCPNDRIRRIIEISNWRYLQMLAKNYNDKLTVKDWY